MIGTEDGDPGWSYYDVHGLLRIRANTRISAIPPYFRVDSVEPNFEVRRVDRLPIPDARDLRRIVGHTAYELGGGELQYETDVPILFLLGSRARWKFRLQGLADDVTRLWTEVPFFDFQPVRYKVAQLLSKLTLLLMTIKLVGQGHAMCHATSVAKDGRATMLFGFSGTGKSTLASRLMHQGYELLADDYAIVDPRGEVLCYPDWHKPRSEQARLPLSKYVGIHRSFVPGPLRVAQRARAGPVLVMERGPDHIEELDRGEALRRILLLNFEEISKLWNSPISVVLNHYAYFYPDLDLQDLMGRYRAIVTSFLDRAGPFVSVRSSSPRFRILEGGSLDRITGGGP